MKWDLPGSRDYERLALNTSEENLTQLENVGSQLAVCFNEEGSVLATGGEVCFTGLHILHFYCSHNKSYPVDLLQLSYLPNATVNCSTGMQYLGVSFSL